MNNKSSIELVGSIWVRKATLGSRMDEFGREDQVGYYFLAKALRACEFGVAATVAPPGVRVAY